MPPSFDCFLPFLVFFFFNQSKSTFAAERDRGIQEVVLRHKKSPHSHVASVTPGSRGEEGSVAAGQPRGTEAPGVHCEDRSDRLCW